MLLLSLSPSPLDERRRCSSRERRIGMDERKEEEEREKGVDRARRMDHVVAALKVRVGEGSMPNGESLPFLSLPFRPWFAPPGSLPLCFRKN
jgi:hypothetical protein